MEQDRWYLIRFDCGEKAGRVIDVGKPPGKVLVVTRWDVYLAGDIEGVDGRFGRLDAVTDDHLIEAALTFLETGKNPHRPDGDPLRNLEAGWVNTNDVLGDLHEARDALNARRAADLAARQAKDAAERAARLAVADRWAAVRELVNEVNPNTRARIGAGGESRILTEGDVMVRAWSYDEHGRTGHMRLEDRQVTYGELLRVYEAWAADRALLSQGCAA